MNLVDLGLERTLPSFRGYDLVGITVRTAIYNETKRLIRVIRSETDAPIVLGGPHPSAQPQRCIIDSDADYVVFGEGEITMLELVNLEKPTCKIKGLIYREGSSVKVNESRPLIEDLDKIPFPAWHLMPPNRYPIVPLLASAEKLPIAPVITSRGCPYSCIFCAAKAIWGHKWRHRSAKNVVDEIELLIRRYGAKEIHISDDNFTLDKKHAMNVCNEILHRGLDVSWSCPNGVRIDRLDGELLQTMRKAGCHLLCFGIESGSPKTLRRIKKGIDDIDLFYKVVRKARKVGIMTMGSFIIGLPEDTPETIRKTINFAKKLDLDRAWFNILIPLPGSEIWETEPIVGDDWGNCYVQLPAVTRDEVVEWQRRATREFYLRPRILLSLLKYIKFGHINHLIGALKWVNEELR